MASPGCSSVAVKWQQFSPTAASPVQAPRQLPALFNDCHALVYGFVPHCTQVCALGAVRKRQIEKRCQAANCQGCFFSILNGL